MQASRSMSPHLKGQKHKSGRANTSNKSPPIDQNASSAKSVAQRVMDVTSGTSNSPSNNTTNGTRLSPILAPESGNINQTLASDREVEEISRRTSRIEISDQSLSQQVVTNSELDMINLASQQHRQSRTNRFQQQQQTEDQSHNRLVTIKDSAPNSTSPSLLQDSEPLTQTTTSNGTLQENSMALGSDLIGNDSVFKDAFRPLSPLSQPSNQIKQSIVSANENGLVDKSISLDTKIPLPSPGEFCLKDSTTVNMEEVSYYNDQAKANLTSTNDSTSNAAGWFQSQFNQLNYPTSTKTSTSSSNSLLNPKQEHNNHLNYIVPETMPQRGLNLEQQQQQQRQDTGYMNSNRIIEDDIDDTRYDNALMEEHLNNKEQEQANVLMSSSTNGDVNQANTAKAKSAPATPCNVTPIAFHQNTSHFNSALHPNPANTMPPDIRKNITATCRVLPSSISGETLMTKSAQRCSIRSQYLDDLVKKGQQLFMAEDYAGAIESFSLCIDLASSQNPQYLKDNYKVYGQRAEAHLHSGLYNEAIEDSKEARAHRNWSHAYYIQGQAHFKLGQQAEALTAFAFGLSLDPQDKRLFETLVDVALKSSLGKDFEPKYNRLRSLGLESKQFIVVSTLGQELLANGHCKHAIIVLESALKLGPENKKLVGAVLSSIGYAYSTMNDYEKAVNNMLREYEIESEHNNVQGQLRVLSNLGYAYYKMGKLDKSLESHRKQVALAFRTKIYQSASTTLNAIGHIHMSLNDCTSALTSHTRCLKLLRELDETNYNQSKELSSIGYVNCMLNDFKAANESYNEALNLIDRCDQRKLNGEMNHYGRIMIHFNQAYLSLKKRLYLDAIHYYELILSLVDKIPNPRRTLVKMRVSNGLGQTYRLLKKYDEARGWFDKQLQLAESINDKVGQSQALCNLGMICQHFKDYSRARELFKTNLRLVKDDALLKAFAHSYIGSMYFLEARFTDAQVHYESSRNLFHELDRQNERRMIELNLDAIRGKTSTSSQQQRRLIKCDSSPEESNNNSINSNLLVSSDN